MAVNGILLLAETWYLVLHVVMRWIHPPKSHLTQTGTARSAVLHGLEGKSAVQL